MKKSNTPEFDIWLVNKMQNDSSIHFEEAFNEYISEFNILFHKSLPDSAPKTSVKLQLIEDYNIDDIMGEDERYLNYKRSLTKSS